MLSIETGLSSSFIMDIFNVPFSPVLYCALSVHMLTCAATDCVHKTAKTVITRDIPIILFLTVSPVGILYQSVFKICHEMKRHDNYY